MFTFLLVLHAIVAVIMVGVILMQRSEGGGLGMGGSPAGLMSARGAADFLTRATTILAVLFVGISIALAAVATLGRAPTTIDTSLARPPLADAPAPGAPLSGNPDAAAAPLNTASPVPLAVPAAPAAQPARSTATPQPRTQAQGAGERPAPARKDSAPAAATTAAPSAPAKAPEGQTNVPAGLIPPANSN